MNEILILRLLFWVMSIMCYALACLKLKRCGEDCIIYYSYQDNPKSILNFTALEDGVELENLDLEEILPQLANVIKEQVFKLKLAFKVYFILGVMFSAAVFILSSITA